MNNSLSSRSQAIQTSATLAMAARAQELRQEGKSIISLTVGEPDFDTPDFIKQAAINAIEDGFTKYTAVDGIKPLKNAICYKLKRDNQLEYSHQEIIVSNGVKQSLYNICQAILNPGDEVIIPAPYWVSYPAMAILAGAKPVYIDTDLAQDFKVTPEQLAQAITPQTRLLILNSPSNPTGKLYTHTELAALAEVLKRHPQVYVASDEIYEYLVWHKPGFVNLMNVCPDLRNQVLICNGVSKAYAMTGWRIGYTAGPSEVISAMKKIQSHSTGNANSIAQMAAVAALKSDKQQLQTLFDSLEHRHHLVYQALSQLSELEVSPADGAFYLFPKVTKTMERLGIDNDVDFGSHLLDKIQVATIPGSAFGCPGYLRLSFATSVDQLHEALSRFSTIFQ